MYVCVSLAMDICVSSHCKIKSFQKLLDTWITEAGLGCSMRFINVCRTVLSHNEP